MVASYICKYPKCGYLIRGRNELFIVPTFFSHIKNVNYVTFRKFNQK